MAELPLISVVVPVYNVESYLNRCIDSILAQSFTSFELLLVDDGSTDESGKICETYSKIDNRVISLTKDNGGLSDARNYGLQFIKGEYVTFIDSDDWVEGNYLSYLYDSIRLEDSDMSTCIYSIRRGDSATPWKALPIEPVVISGREALLSLLRSDAINVSANGKLFRSSIFDAVRFPYGKKFEDVGTTYKLITRCRSVAVGGAPLYNYFMRSNSITHSANSGIFDRFELAETAYKELKVVDEEIANAAERYLVFHALSVLRSCNLDDKTHRDKAEAIRKEVMCHRMNVLKCGSTPKRDRIALFALSFGLPAYQFAWGIYCAFTGRTG